MAKKKRPRKRTTKSPKAAPPKGLPEGAMTSMEMGYVPSFIGKPSAPKEVFKAQKDKLFSLKAIKKDPVFKFERTAVRFAREMWYGAKYSAEGQVLSRVAAGTKKAFLSPGGQIVRKAGFLGMLAVGGAAMVGIGMMRGALDASKDVVMERYLQDQRYSRNMLMNSRVGYSMGSQSMNRHGNLNGLALALHTGRHGRGF